VDKLRNVGIFLLLLAAASYAIYRAEQTVAAIALILLIATSYRHLVKPFIARAEAFASRVDYAKFRDLELRSAQQAAELVKLEGLQLTLIQDVIIRNLEPELYGLLVNLTTHDKTQVDRSHIERLRQLRDHGLIEHDRERLRDSATVWLTPLGNEVAEILARPSGKFGSGGPGPQQQATPVIDQRMARVPRSNWCKEGGVSREPPPESHVE
jgi:hypothetical protein